MNIILRISENNIRLSLFYGNKERDSIVWQDRNSLSHLFLNKLNKLFSNNRVGLDKINGYKIISDIPENWTTYRIAKITLESLILAKKIGL
jgi:hypothetical protein